MAYRWLIDSSRESAVGPQIFRYGQVMSPTNTFVIRVIGDGGQTPS